MPRVVVEIDGKRREIRSEEVAQHVAYLAMFESVLARRIRGDRLIALTLIRTPVGHGCELTVAVE